MDLNSVLHLERYRQHKKSKGIFVDTCRRVVIVSFLNHIQEKNVGRQRNAGNGGTGRGRNSLMGCIYQSQRIGGRV
jgi:hypothetical protein